MTGRTDVRYLHLERPAAHEARLLQREEDRVLFTSCSHLIRAGTLGSCTTGRHRPGGYT
jgi:hypothetical protein